MKKLIIFLLAIFMFGILQTVHAAETPQAVIYVSPKGNDGAEGSLKNPLRTIKAAKGKVQALKGKFEGDITVYFLSGVYQFTDTEIFTKNDSGSANQKIIYKAAPDSEVYFSGGYTIPSEAFTAVSNPLIKERLYENVRNKILQVNLSKTLGIKEYGAVYRSNPYTKETPDTTALYIDGFKQTLARWPNNDYALTGTVLTSARGNDGKGGIFQYIENAPDRWKKANDIWLHGFWAWDWYDDSLRVEKLDLQKREFTLAQNTSFGMAKGKRYYAFNLLEEIDTPGEWYLERTTGILYFYPPADLKGKKIQFSSLSKEILRFENCANIIVDGITFENSCFSGININNCENILIRGSTFRNLGGQGVNIKGGRACGVAGSDFYDLGKGGVFLDGGDRINLISSEHYVENCYFTRFALSIKTYVPAIQIDGCGHRVSGNVMHDGPHSAITGGGNNFIIENNEIYDVCKETSDAGAFYTGRDWTRQGNILRNNIVHDVYGVDGHGAHAFYFDDGESGYEVYQNTFYNVATPVFIHGGHDFNIYDNTVANSINSITIINLSKSRYDIDHDTSFFLLPNYLKMPVKSEAWQKSYPWLANLLNEQYEYPLHNTIERTLSYKSQNVTVSDKARETGRFENNYASDGKLPFEDEKTYNFSLTEEIPQIKGFKSTDYSKVGLKLDENRKKLPETNKFSLIYPKNGDINVVGNKLNLSWQPSLGATKYKVTIAEDRNFYKVTQSAEVIGTTLQVNGLLYGGKKYYWKVEAVGTSYFSPYIAVNSEGASSFKTAMKEILDKASLAAVLDKAQQLVAKASIGENVGDYSEQGKTLFEKIVMSAKTVNDDKDTSQTAIDKSVSELELGVKNFEATRKSGNVSMKELINNPVGWKASNANFIRITDNTLTFLPVNGGVVMGYQEILPSYPIWTFNAKFDLTANWQGFGMRAADPTSVGWSTTSYMIILKSDAIELHRFYLGGKTFETIPNDFVQTGTEHKIELGTLDIDGGGVNIIFRVDGKTVFDVKDTDGYIPDNGLLTIYASDGRAVQLTAD